MAWDPYYRGDGVERDVVLPEPPPWRTFPRQRNEGAKFQPPPGLVEAVNAALCLRRPLLLTGPPGSGKSMLIESVAAELRLGNVLRWHITSQSTLTNALYRYDVLGRIHAQQFAQASGQPTVDDISDFLWLGPLGAALAPAPRPRALLIDEIDKSDLDLPSDLLDVLESGEFEIPELARQIGPVRIREAGSDAEHELSGGWVRCTTFPFIVMTSNGERDFPAPFLRRCIRFRLPPIDEQLLQQIVNAHLGADVSSQVSGMLNMFAQSVHAGGSLATDQLLNAVFLVTGDSRPNDDDRTRLTELLLQQLTNA